MSVIKLVRPPKKKKKTFLNVFKPNSLGKSAMVESIKTCIIHLRG